MTTRAYNIRGMSCASCAKSIEACLNETNGIREARVDVSRQTASITFEDETLPIAELQRRMDDLGSYTISEADGDVPNGKSGSSHRPFWTWALMGAVGISIIFYLIQVLGMRDWQAPFSFLKQQWYFVLPLILGFAIQMGLYAEIRRICRHGKGMLAASGGVSGGAMAACCLHNLVYLVPMLGLTGLATFLSAYQAQVFMISILFMIIGNAYFIRMYLRMKPHDVKQPLLIHS